MDRQAGRNYRAHLLNKCVCSRCWGELVERVIDGAETIECPRGCDGGFVTRRWASEALAQAQIDFYEVARNYPALAPPKTLTTAQVRVALFGEE